MELKTYQNMRIWDNNWEMGGIKKGVPVVHRNIKVKEMEI